MERFQEAIDRIKIVECPTGDLESKIRGILQDYRVDNVSKVIVNRDERYDSKEGKGYSATILTNDGREVDILAKSGMDDYVTKVIDVHMT